MRLLMPYRRELVIGRGMGAEDFGWTALALELRGPSNASAGVPVPGG